MAADAPLGDRSGMAYSGTLVVYGQATGIVVATASDTEIGHINRMLAGIRNLSTPLLRQIDRFGRYLALTILALSAATFLRPQQVIEYDRAALAAVRDAIVTLAEAEDLPAHGDAVVARFPRQPQEPLDG